MQQLQAGQIHPTQQKAISINMLENVVATTTKQLFIAEHTFVDIT